MTAQRTKYGALLVTFLTTSLLLGGCFHDNNDKKDRKDTAQETQRVEKAKDAVTELRTWSDSLLKLAENGEAFQTEIELTTTTTDILLTEVGDAFLLSLVAVAEAIQTHGTDNDAAGSYALADMLAAAKLKRDPNDSFELPSPIAGEIVISDYTATLTEATLGETSTSVAVTYPRQSGKSFTLDITQADAENSAAYINTSAGTVSLTFLDTVDNIYRTGLSQATLKNATYDLEIKAGQKTTDSTPNPVRFEGETSFELVTTLDGNDVSYNPVRMQSRGLFANNDAEFESETVWGMKNAATFVPLEPLKEGHINDNIGRYEFSEDGNTAVFYFDEEIITFSFLTEDGSVVVTTFDKSSEDEYSYTSLSGWQNLQDYLDFYFYFSREVVVRYEGYYVVNLPATWEASATLSGTLSFPFPWDENKDNWRELTYYTRYMAQLPELPPTEITLNLERTSFTQVDAALSFAYQDYVVTLEVLASEHKLVMMVENTANNTTLTLNFSEDNLDEIEDWNDPNRVIEQLNIDGTVTVDGVVTGTFVKRKVAGSWTVLISYTNGDEETVLY